MKNQNIADDLPEGNYAISPIDKQDIEPIVKIHMASFQGFFLTFLGHSFLKYFYQMFVESSYGVGVVAKKEQHAVGFACGTIHPTSFYRDLIQRKWFYLSVSAIPAIIKQPKTIMRLLGNVVHNTRGSVNSSAVLLSIAVYSDEQESGCGKLLIEEFIKTIKHQGASRVSLSTDRENNEKVNRFYRNIGFKLIHKAVTSYGRRINEYSMDI